MKSAFKRLCLISFCIVVAAVPLGIFEYYFFAYNQGRLLGCNLTNIIPGIECGYGVVNTAKEIILNIPVWLIFGPVFLYSLVRWQDLPLSIPLIIFISVHTAIVLLAVVHIVHLAVRLAKRLMRKQPGGLRG